MNSILIRTILQEVKPIFIYVSAIRFVMSHISCVVSPHYETFALSNIHLGIFPIPAHSFLGCSVSSYTASCLIAFSTRSANLLSRYPPALHMSPPYCLHTACPSFDNRLKLRHVAVRLDKENSLQDSRTSPACHGRSGGCVGRTSICIMSSSGECTAILSETAETGFVI